MNGIVDRPGLTDYDGVLETRHAPKECGLLKKLKYSLSVVVGAVLCATRLAATDAAGSPNGSPKLAKPSTRPATSPVEPPKTPEAIERGVIKSHDLIAAGQFDEARKLLEPLVKAAPDNPRVNLGLGYALLKLGKAKEAIPKLEKAYAADPTIRTLAMTLAAALQNENPMRAARVLKEYMAVPSHPADEELQNALGSILNHAAKDPKVNKEAFFEECRAFYMSYDQRLNEQHGGEQKHWGTQWIAADDAEEKWKTVIARQKSAKELGREAELCTRGTAKAKDDLQIVHNGFGLHSDREKKQVAANYKAAVAAEERAYAAYHKADELLEKTEQPPFQKSVATPPFWQKE